MKEQQRAPLHMWLTEPLSDAIEKSVDRLRITEGVQHIALMPDVHLSAEVCVGTVVATDELIYPEAVGGDIGCGMAALAFDTDAAAIENERAAATVLAGLYEYVPANKHRVAPTLPNSLDTSQLSHSRLQRLAEREGRWQLGTLGRGNHFLEFQVDQQARLWVMVHSGSRAMGQAILHHHAGETISSLPRNHLQGLLASSPCGQDYLSDAGWAREYARESRLAMLRQVEHLLLGRLGITADWDSLIHSDHNHVQQENHGGKALWVHRKGAQKASEGEAGIVPGSMGSVSFHSLGRGCEASLRSCSHGAGRRLSRTEARRKVSSRSFARQMQGVWFDRRRTSKLRDEAPMAYKDIRQVMRAQKALTHVARELRPLLNYKGA